MSKGEFEKRMQKQFLSNRYSQMTDLSPILDAVHKDFCEALNYSKPCLDKYSLICVKLTKLSLVIEKWFGSAKK